jgi:hypothetical protein
MFKLVVLYADIAIYSLRNIIQGKKQKNKEIEILSLFGAFPFLFLEPEINNIPKKEKQNKRN